MSVAHGIGEPRRLERQMEAVGTERIKRGEIEALHDVEQHQRGQALRIGRQFQHVETAIIGADRRDRLAAMTSKVLGGEEGPAGGNGRDDVVGDRPFVERARALRCDRAERSRQRREFDDVAFRRRQAVEQEMARGAGIGAQLADLSSPVPGDARGDGKSALGVVDRRSERAIEGKASMRVEDRRPGVDRARHGHGVDRVARDGGDATRHERLERGSRAGASGAVVTPDRLTRRLQHAEAIAADAGHLRLDHAQDRDRGDCRVGGVAAGAQRLDGGEARQRMRGRGHALASDDRRAAGQLKIAAHDDSSVSIPKFANPCGTPPMRTSESKGH